MSKTLLVRGLTSLAILMAFIAVYIISPVAQAFNTHSVDLERGSSQFLSIADGSQTGLDLSNAATLEAWVKFESLSGAQHIISKGSFDDETASYDFLVRDVDGWKITFRITGNGAVSGMEEEDFSWSPSTGTWYHIAATYDGSTVKAYVNGSQLGANASTSVSSLHNSNRSFRIGSHETGTGDPENTFDGLIDDVRVWNVVRTSEEIADDYDTELNGNETGLVGYWKLNNSLSDLSSSGNTLTNNNSATFTTDSAFNSFVEDLADRKSANESVTSSAVLQDDNDLVLNLDASKTYVVDGVIFASSTSATPDIKIGFTGQTGADIRLGYTTDNQNEVLIGSGSSAGIPLQANTPRAIHVAGTVTTQDAGDFKLKWAQNSSNAAATTVMKGSYLRAQEI